LGVLVDEPFRGAGVGGGQYVGADGPNRAGSSIVDIDRLVPGYAGMVMLGVVPSEAWMVNSSRSTCCLAAV
jgi:hypothetical protein